MDVSLKKSIRNGLYAGIIITLFSFIYGGIYTEMIVEGIGFSLGNILLAIIGAVFAGIPFFLLVFVISLIVFYFKEKRKK